MDRQTLRAEVEEGWLEVECDWVDYVRDESSRRSCDERWMRACSPRSFDLDRAFAMSMRFSVRMHVHARDMREARRRTTTDLTRE
jgi:hypothetical protein